MIQSRLAGTQIASRLVSSFKGTYTGDSPVGVAPRRISGRGASVVVLENGRIKRVSDYYDFDNVFR